MSFESFKPNKTHKAESARQTEAEKPTNEKNEQIGEDMSFEEALAEIDKYADIIVSNDTEADYADAEAIREMIGGAFGSNLSDFERRQGLDKLIEYTQGALASNEAIQGSRFAESEEELDKRGRVIQTLKEERDKLRDSTQSAGPTALLEQLYTTADIGEDVPSREEFLKKVAGMSDEELSLLGKELSTIQREFYTNHDFKELDARLTELNFKSFQQEGVAEEKSAVEEILSAPELKNAFDSEYKGYVPEKGVAVVYESLSSLYGPSEAGRRIEDLTKEYESFIEKASNEKPDKSDEAYRFYASKQVLSALNQQERQTIEGLLNKRYEMMGGSGQRMISAEAVMSDLLNYLSGKL